MMTFYLYTTAGLRIDQHRQRAVSRDRSYQLSSLSSSSTWNYYSGRFSNTK